MVKEVHTLLFHNNHKKILQKNQHNHIFSFVTFQKLYLATFTTKQNMTSTFCKMFISCFVLATHHCRSSSSHVYAELIHYRLASVWELLHAQGETSQVLDLVASAHRGGTQYVFVPLGPLATMVCRQIPVPSLCRV